jgi:hypothetical protein
MDETETEYGVSTTLFGKMPEIVYNSFYPAHHVLCEKPYRVAYVGYEAIYENEKEIEDGGDETKKLFTVMHNAYLCEDNAEEYMRNLRDGDSALATTAAKLLSMRRFRGATKELYKERGYIVNHTKKVAIDLADYYKGSEIGKEAVIDPLPILTGTGCGAQMVFFDGASANTTYELFNAWCWDILQITSALPAGYDIIPCYFAPMYVDILGDAYKRNGCDENGYLLNDKKKAYSVIMFTVRGDAYRCSVSVEKLEKDSREGLRFLFQNIESDGT